MGLVGACLLATVPPKAAALPGSGGAGVAPAPRIAGAKCTPRPKKPCMSTRSVSPGGGVRIGGRYLDTVAKVIFFGGAGGADNVTTTRLKHRRSGIDVSVPLRAKSGPIALVSSAGARSARWTGLLVQDPTRLRLLPGDGRTMFYGSPQKPEFSFQVGGDQPVDVQISLMRVGDQSVVQTWTKTAVLPGTPQKVVWNGTAGGRVQPDGYYYFSLSGAAAQGASATGPENSFAFYGHIFPVRGKHSFGGAAGRFGASRSGHTHQGQDVMAACGTPLVAARAGTVVYSGYHARAGYYVVVHGKESGLDYAYMHLRDHSFLETGDSVYTGQPIGVVGRTGDATACHLHFELWSAPGWYKGGAPFDPLSDLQCWDRVS